MTKKSSTLFNVSLCLVFFALVVLAVQFLILKPATKRARARSCYSQLAQILVESRMYAWEHGTGFQTNLLCLSNKMSPRWLVCVDDEVRRRRVDEKGKPALHGSAVHWSRLTMDDYSYQAILRDSNTLVVRCPFHKIGGYTDGEMDKDGSWIKWEGEHH